MSLFDELFGGIQTSNNSEAPLVSFEEEKKPAKKEAEKKESKGTDEKKSTEKKAKGKKLADPTVILPVMVKARGWKVRVDGSGEKKLSEILKGLIEQGYRELALSKIGAVYLAAESGDNLVYITLTGGMVANSDDTMVSFENGSITVMDGELQMQITPDMFEGLDADEITVGKLRDRWVAQNPDYKGCELVVEGDVAYPVLDTSINKDDLVPETLVVNGERITIEDTLTAADVIKKYYGEGKEVQASIKKMGDEMAALVYTSYSSEVKKGVDALKENKAKVEQKYKLPLKVLFTTIGRTFDLKPEDFDGKQKITMEELKKHLAKTYTVFSDDKKQVESVYVEEENTLSLAIVSGRKG